MRDRTRIEPVPDLLPDPPKSNPSFTVRLAATLLATAAVFGSAGLAVMACKFFLRQF